MKLLSWNCHGLGNTLTVQALRALVTRERPDIVFLMETKNQNIVIQKIQRRLKFPNSFVVSPVGLAGGLVVFWNAQMQLSIERHNAHFIDLLCTAHPRSSPMRITCIHAPSVYLQ